MTEPVTPIRELSADERIDYVASMLIDLVIVLRGRAAPDPDAAED